MISTGHDRPALLDATGVAKSYGAVVALRDASLTRRRAGRGPRADGRQRRRQEHARQDPHRRRSARRRSHHRPWARAHRPLPGGGTTRRPRLGLPGAGAHPRPRRRRQPAPDRARRSSRSATGWPSSASTATSNRHDRPTCRSPLLRILDLARALAIEPDVLMLDEMTAALPANLTERVLEVIGRQRGGDRSVIFISHRLLEISGALRPRHRAARRRATVGVVDPSRAARSGSSS